MGEGNILHCVSTAKHLGVTIFLLLIMALDVLANMVSRVTQTVHHAGLACPTGTTLARDIRICHVVTALQRRRHSAVTYTLQGAVTAHTGATVAAKDKVTYHAVIGSQRGNRSVARSPPRTLVFPLSTGHRLSVPLSYTRNAPCAASPRGDNRGRHVKTLECTVGNGNILHCVSTAKQLERSDKSLVHQGAGRRGRHGTQGHANHTSCWVGWKCGDCGGRRK